MVYDPDYLKKTSVAIMFHPGLVNLLRDQRSKISRSKSHNWLFGPGMSSELPRNGPQV